MSELNELKCALPMVGAEPSVLDDPRVAHIVGHGNRILSHRTVPGLHVDLEERAEAIAGKMVVDAGVRIAEPIHMCFGLAHETGVQHINIDVEVGEEAQVHVLAHCLFPLAKLPSIGCARRWRSAKARR